MNFKNPNSLVFLLSALEGIGESKKHLKQSAHELLLAAKVMNKTTTDIVQESGLPKSLPWVSEFMKVGGTVLDELLKKTKAPQETRSETQEESSSEEPKKIHRGKTKLKVVKTKS